jgi:hypothetical protein
LMNTADDFKIISAVLFDMRLVCSNLKCYR